MTPFFVAVLSVFFLIVSLQFVLLRFILPQRLSRVARLAASFVLTLGVNVIPFLYLLSGNIFDDRSWWHRELVIFPYAILLISSAFSGSLIVLLWLITSFCHRLWPRLDEGRRRFLGTSARMLTGTSLGVSAYGAYHENKKPEVSRIVLPYRKLHSDLNGFRLVHVTDIHSGPFISFETIGEVVDMANSLKPDLIVLTGDYVNSNPAYIRGCVQVLDELRAPAGVFGVFGNHDYYTGISAMREAFSRARISILSDSRGAGRGLEGLLNIVGVEDPVSGWANDAEFPNLKHLSGLVLPGRFNLLLSHRPGIFRASKHWDVPLTLAGHTHGGQIIFPGIARNGFSLAGLFVTYTHGLYRSDIDPQVRMYVNRGIGTIIAPVRLFCPPEIAEITLVQG